MSVLCDFALSAGGRIQIRVTASVLDIALQNADGGVFLGIVNRQRFAAFLTRKNADIDACNDVLIRKHGHHLTIFEGKLSVCTVTLSTEELSQLQTAVGDPFTL